MFLLENTLSFITKTIFLVKIYSILKIFINNLYSWDRVWNDFELNKKFYLQERIILISIWVLTIIKVKSH